MFFIGGSKHYICPYKYLTGIPCPGCGLTRAFRCLLVFDFVGAWRFNILSPLIFLWFVVVFLVLCFDFIRKTDYLTNILFLQLKSRYLIMGVGLAFLSLYFNIIRDI